MNVKNTLSDISKSISKGAEATIKKSEDLFSISKLMLEISSEESNIKDIYTKIGEKIYKRYEKGRFDDKELEDYFESIDRSRKEIRELKREIDNIKNITVCSNCGCEMSSHSKYCPECGRRQ